MSNYILEEKNPENNTWTKKKFDRIDETVREILTNNIQSIKGNNGNSHIFMIIFATPNSEIHLLSQKFISQLQKYLDATENNGWSSFDINGQTKNIRIVHESNSKDDYLDTIVGAIVSPAGMGGVKIALNYKAYDALPDILGYAQNVNGVDNAVFIIPQSGIEVSESTEKLVSILAQALGKQIIVYKCKNDDQFQRQQVQYKELLTNDNYLKKKDIIEGIVLSVQKEHQDECAKLLAELISKLYTKKQRDKPINEELKIFSNGEIK